MSAQADSALQTRLSAAWRWLASGPASMAMVAAMWVATLATRSLGGPRQLTLHEWTASLAALEDGRWWTALTSMLLPGNGLYLVGATLLLASAGVVAERLLGSMRMVAIGVGSHVAATLVGLGMLGAFTPDELAWNSQIASQHSHGMFTFAVAVLLASTARMSPQLRLQVRVATPLALLVMVAVSGQLHDVIRLLGGLIGLIVGHLVWGRQSRSPRLPGTAREGRVLVALAVAAVVFGVLVSTFSTHAYGPLASLRALTTGSPYSLEQLTQICADEKLTKQCMQAALTLRGGAVAPVIMLVMPQLLQLVLALGLYRGRRAALWGTYMLQGVLLLLGVVRLMAFLGNAATLDGASRAMLGLAPTALHKVWLAAPIAIPVAIIALLFICRRLFTVRGEPGAYRRVLVSCAAMSAIVIAAGTVVGMTMAEDFVPPASALYLVADQVVRLVPSVTVGVLASPLLPGTLMAAAVVEWPPVVVWTILVVGVYRTITRHAEVGDAVADRQRVRELLRSQGGSTLSWWSTWDGNSYWFSPTRDAAVPYRVIGGVALPPCGPICRPGDAETVAREFAEFAADQGLTPALYSVHEPFADVTDSLGWARLQVAEETLIDLPTLAFTGKKFQDVRTAINRAAKEGVSTEWHTWAELPQGLRDQVRAISEEWGAQKGLPEMGFMLGGLPELDDPDVRILIAVDAERTIHGATSWMPVYRDSQVVGLTLDFMRRRTGGFRPVMELMIAQAALDAKEEGLEFLSLSGAPLARTTNPPHATGGSLAAASETIENVLEKVGGMLEPVYGFRSLLFFKSKFQPRYAPMYLVVPELASLPTVGVAVGRAYVPHLSLGQGVQLGSGILRH